MTGEQVWVLGLLGLVFLLLVREVVPPGVSGIFAIAGLLLGGKLLGTSFSPFNGLIDIAVIAVACMFVISAGVTRTGAVGLITDTVFRDGGNAGRRYVMILLFVMVASGFLNNTPLVLIFMPLVLGLAAELKLPPSKLLIPLSFVSILGGMCTKIGTSTNLIVASEAAKANLELDLFSFTPMGIVLAVSGAVFLAFFAERLLPSRASLGLSASKGIASEYMTELEISSGSRYVDRTIGEAFPQPKEGSVKERVRVLQLIRNDVIHAAAGDIRLQAGDLLLIKGDPAAIVRFHDRQDTGRIPIMSDGSEDTDATRQVAMTLVEVVVTPGSRWIDRRVKDVKFRERYGVGVFAVQRHGAHLREKVGEIRLRPGDILLVQGDLQNLDHLKVAENILVIEGVHRGIPHTARAPMALVGVITFVVLATMTGVHIAALVSALIMVLGRCVTAAEAYRALDWDVLFLLGGSLALGTAFRETQLADMIARWIVAGAGDYGERAVICGIFLITTLITQVLSNNAAAAVMTPLAYAAGISFAEAAGGTPEPTAAMPYVMAVAFGASCCFLTPIGYNTNLLVYGPGGYKFTDFLRIGLPLTVIFAILTTILLPIIY